MKIEFDNQDGNKQLKSLEWDRSVDITLLLLMFGPVFEGPVRGLLERIPWF
jgi:hypothetical protein